MRSVAFISIRHEERSRRSLLRQWGSFLAVLVAAGGSIWSNACAADPNVPKDAPPEARPRTPREGIDSSLDWLARHQLPTGHWSFQDLHLQCEGDSCTPLVGEDRRDAGSVRSDPAATAMALLPFLMAGELSGDAKPHQKAVLKGLRRLVRFQNAETGALYGKTGGGSRMYAHGLATLAVCEAYRRSQREEFKEPAQKAVEFIQKSQHPGQGGWRYYVAGETPTGGDTSVFGWQMRALVSARAGELDVSPKSRELMTVYLRVASGGQQSGLFAYEPKGPFSPSMTGVGLLSLQLLEQQPADETVAEAVAYLRQRPPGRGAPDCYRDYYVTDAIRRSSPEHWPEWRDAMRKALLETQAREGCPRGSWSSLAPLRDRWSDLGGRLMVTAFCTMTLLECEEASP